MPTAPLGSSTSSKRRSGEESGTGKPPQKRRRRAFSCLSCQKLKCRCEYDTGAQGCHRCQTLRIECSLRGEYAVTPSHPTPAEQLSPNVEERLQRYEDELREIKSMIKDLTPGAGPRNDRTQAVRDYTHNSHERVSNTRQESPSPEFLSVPADKGAQTAPVVVLRSISQQITRGCRRLLRHINIDLVQLQLLDEQTVNELIQLFFRYQGHNLLVCGIEDLSASDETRKVSDFLRSVCCLIGVVYRDDICGTSIHRQIYEQVRITLGQALLSSPLNLEEINAVLIMSNNANSPSSNGVEYVDSWLLTGYCAKQAMLSISFSKIINNIKEGSLTTEDHKAIHLWSKICLHHLHWAATTGRSSIIPMPYIDQCNILLSFYEATMQDGMLVAEIFLYSTLHQKLAHQSYLGDGGECKEFLAWKEKWNHLLGLSTSSMLRIGYHAACLILAVRSLEEVGQGLRPREFLSGADGNNDNGSDDENDAPLHSRRTKENDGNILRANACKYAMVVLQTFLEMPSFLMDAVPTCLCLCIGYCAILLAHHDESQSKVSDQISLDLITRIDQWITTSPGKAWSYKYGTLAKHKIESRINGGLTSTVSHQPRQPSMRARVEDRNGCQDDRTSVPAGLDGRCARKPTREASGYHANEMFGSSVEPLESESIFQSFDMSDNAIFPSMEDFFGGGFLDFVG
ncbi:uncharacterized protein GGS22DRAFT_156079 [Annulohypoxylon maeteangense]|uniref:uncharacterized protein n=1 Tax=Annulohypoxylon maeteangense TaxID=1927788 RepID=UPI0020072D76|nr:uncharacterized protein GGS22DRAFT_156079 [Annulohypoxylon maeteangense]KAI0888515.1 hypothetical protein GGS22DRAFT_156079 [Annulohypoxylon maeteangense]